MGIRVIAEFESIFKPQIQCRYPVLQLVEVVQLLFIHKTHRRNFLVPQSAQQLRRHFLDFSACHEICRARGKVVNCDGYGPLGRRLCL